jgi:hypothetical protein
MISHQHLRAPSFRWLLAWAVLLCFGASGTAYGQCPPGNNPPAILGLGAGPGSTDRSFGYDIPASGYNDPRPTLLASSSNPTDPNALINKIGNIIPAPGEIRAIAVQRLGANANKFIVAGDFTYRDPATGTTYRNIMRLNAGGSIDPTFTPTFFPGPINALAVDSLDQIVVGGEFIIPGPPNRSRLLRLLPNGALDLGFNPPVPTAAVLALEVDPTDPLNRIYVGLNNGTIGGRLNFTRLVSLVPPTTWGPDPGAFWSVASQPPFQTSVNGPVRAIKYSPNLFGIGQPGVVVGGTFTQATGGTSQNVGNIALFDLNGAVDTFFPTTGGAANGTVNALAVVPAVPPLFFDQIFAGGEFSLFNQVARPRVAKFTSQGLDLPFNPPQVPFPTRCGRWC